MTIPGNERALSEVVGFVLLLGVIVAAFSLWLTYVVPSEGREGEIDQMNAVKDRFTDYKTSLDSLWVNNQTGITLSTSFDLGTGGGNTEASGLFIPLLKPRSSSATLSVADFGDRFTVDGSAYGTRTTNMTVLEYRSANSYWLQQRYYYQLGGVFLAQDTGSVNRISPSISIVYNSDNTVSVYLVPIELQGGGSIGGNGPVKVDSRLRPRTEETVFQPNSYVNISAGVTDRGAALMWMDSVFNASRVRGGLVSPSAYTFGVTENPATKRATAWINVTGPYSSGLNDVYLTVRPAVYVVSLNNIASGLT